MQRISKGRWDMKGRRELDVESERNWEGGEKRRSVLAMCQEFNSVTYIQTRDRVRVRQREAGREGLNRQICSFQQQKTQRADCYTRTEQCLYACRSLLMSVHKCATAGGQSATSRASKWPQMVCPLKAMALLFFLRCFLSVFLPCNPQTVCPFLENQSEQ